MPVDLARTPRGFSVRQESDGVNRKHGLPIPPGGDIVGRQCALAYALIAQGVS